MKKVRHTTKTSDYLLFFALFIVYIADRLYFCRRNIEKVTKRHYHSTMAEQVSKQEKPNVLKQAFSKTWEAAMRLKGSVVVNDAALFL